MKKIHVSEIIFLIMMDDIFLHTKASTHTCRLSTATDKRSKTKQSNNDVAEFGFI